MAKDWTHAAAPEHGGTPFAIGPWRGTPMTNTEPSPAENLLEAFAHLLDAGCERLPGMQLDPAASYPADAPLWSREELIPRKRLDT
jgi:hypothetical protein